MHTLVHWRESFRALRRSILAEPRNNKDIWRTVGGDALREIYKTLPPLNSKDEIRLMHLQPGRSDEPIRCTLENVSLSNEPQYEALSYAWSRSDKPEETPTETLYVNGTLIHTLANLNSALNRLRDTKEPRVLWTDYICINQGDVEERNSQVRRMGEIFHSAWRVVCYLGEADSSAEEAIKLFKVMASKERHLQEYFPDDDDRTILRKATALEQFFLRPWFLRIWTVQEVVLSKSAIMVCGPHTMPWDMLKDLGENMLHHRVCCEYFTQLHPTLEDAWPAINSANSRCVYHEDQFNSFTLCQLLERFLKYRATDPRDHVYGLVGLMNPVRKDMINIDYGLPTEVVFRRTAVEIMRHEDTAHYLVCMFCAEHNPNIMPGLPSWVASFNYLEPNYFLSRASLLFNACGANGKAQFRVIDEQTVTYDGLVVDRVSAIDEDALALEKLEDGIKEQADALRMYLYLVNLERMVDTNEKSLVGAGREFQLMSTEQDAPPQSTAHSFSEAAKTEGYLQQQVNNPPNKQVHATLTAISADEAIAHQILPASPPQLELEVVNVQRKEIVPAEPRPLDELDATPRNLQRMYFPPVAPSTFPISTQLTVGFVSGAELSQPRETLPKVYIAATQLKDLPADNASGLDESTPTNNPSGKEDVVSPSLWTTPLHDHTQQEGHSQATLTDFTPSTPPNTLFQSKMLKPSTPVQTRIGRTERYDLPGVGTKNPPTESEVSPPQAPPPAGSSFECLSPLRQALYRTVAVGVVEDRAMRTRRLVNSDASTYVSARHNLATYAASGPRTPIWEFLKALDTDNNFPYSQTFSLCVQGMRFFLTECGRMGMGPVDIQVGDEVAVFKGGKMPFVVKPCGYKEVGTAEGGKTPRQVHEFVGAAYVDGIMDGEAVGDAQEGSTRRRYKSSTGPAEQKETGLKKWTEIYLV